MQVFFFFGRVSVGRIYHKSILHNSQRKRSYYDVSQKMKRCQIIKLFQLFSKQMESLTLKGQNIKKKTVTEQKTWKPPPRIQICPALTCSMKDSRASRLFSHSRGSSLSWGNLSHPRKMESSKQLVCR